MHVFTVKMRNGAHVDATCTVVATTPSNAITIAIKVHNQNCTDRDIMNERCVINVERNARVMAIED